MTSFKVGDRVELKSCTNFPGTVTGMVRGKVQVRFDDFQDEPLKEIRAESLQFAERPGR